MYFDSSYISSKKLCGVYFLEIKVQIKCYVVGLFSMSIKEKVCFLMNIPVF